MFKESDTKMRSHSDQLLSTAEVGAMLGISAQAVRDIIRSKKIFAELDVIESSKIVYRIKLSGVKRVMQRMKKVKNNFPYHFTDRLKEE